jgi:hypothetical protein
MGDFLRSRLADDVAEKITIALGKDAEGSTVYWQTTANVIDTYLQTSIYASKISDHTLKVQMSRSQLSFEFPLSYARSKQRLAVPIYEAGDAPEQYLAPQILEGFTPFWKQSLFLKYQATTEKFYYFIEDLVADVRRFYDLHLQSGGVPKEPQGNCNPGNPSNPGNPGNRQTAAVPGGYQSVSGQKKIFCTFLMNLRMC